MQFNWIFIMIAGGLILFFFMTVISYQQQLSKNKLGVELASQLELIFSGRGVSPGAKQPIDIADVPIQFECTEYRVMDQRIASGTVLIFAPAELATKKLLTITMSFDLPMRTNTMIMMTSPSIKYYFVNFGPMQEKISTLLDFPLAQEGEKIDYAFIQPTDVTTLNYENNPFVKFIINSDDIATQPPALPPSFAGVGDAQVSAVVVNENLIGDEENLQSSPLAFYQKQGTGWQAEQSGGSPFTLGFPSFIGAVFAKDQNMYTCLMSRALRRATQVVEISRDRADALQAFYNSGGAAITSTEMQQCAVIAAQGGAALASIDAAMAANENNEITISVKSEEFTQRLKAANQANKDAVLNSCPALY